MKIGILSLVLHTNYGGILQSYALQTVLERMGHDVVVLNRERYINKSSSQEALSYAKYLVNRHLFRRNIEYKNVNKQNKERYEREVNTRAFIEKYIHTLTVSGITKDSLREMDAVVVGSDQVWRPRYFKKYWKAGIEDAFLQFLGNAKVKRVAYAASFGTDDWEYSIDETVQCANLLQEFDAVSVRESTAVNLCHERLGYDNAQHVLDPTMLLLKDDYILLVEKAETLKSKGNMMCYILDESEETQQLIRKIAKERGLIPFNTKAKKGCVVPSVEQWLRGFMDAEFVVTDSFHACVFSILFGKPFVVVGNKIRGLSRIGSLLSMFALKKNCIISSSDYNPLLSYGMSPDVAAVLEKRRKDSLEFLAICK